MLMLLTGSIGIACAESPSEVVSTTSKPQVTLHFVSWKPDHPRVWEDALARFTASHPHISVVRELAPHSSTAYHDLLTQRERAGHGSGPGPDIASVKKLGFAGAPMHDALLKRLQAAFEPELFVNHYGSSEVYTFSIDQQALDKPGSAGRAGINTRLRVVRLDAGDVDARVGAARYARWPSPLASRVRCTGPST